MKYILCDFVSFSFSKEDADSIVRRHKDEQSGTGGQSDSKLNYKRGSLDNSFQNWTSDFCT